MYLKCPEQANDLAGHTHTHACMLDRAVHGHQDPPGVMEMFYTQMLW